jgi:crotonobetainyl-CoA:carnitine CoA-transferase CaiB-like acyl-CoA transferase
MAQGSTERALPLAGITVIDVTTSVAGPFGAMILADLGAEVIKIENPEGGDTAREWGKPLDGGGQRTGTFDAYNRNKRSVTLDLWDKDGQQRFRDLIARSDVLIQNLRPGSFEKMGLTPDALRKLNPRLIYCASSGYGRQGPWADQPGYDPLAQAFAGMPEMTGDADRRGVRVGVPIIDLGTGMWAAIGIVGAVPRRAATGEGAVIETALFDTAMGWMSLAFSELLNYQRAPKRMGTAGPAGVAPNRHFPTADGEIAIMAGHNGHFRKLCTALERPDLLEDERFKSSRSRSKFDEELAELIAAVTVTRPRAVWQERLTAQGVPHAPVHTLPEVLGHAQTRANGMLHAGLDGSVEQVALPFKMDGARMPYRKRSPGLGADTEAVVGAPVREKAEA